MNVTTSKILRFVDRFFLCEVTVAISKIVFKFNDDMVYHDTHIQIYYELLTKSMKEQPKQYDDMVIVYTSIMNCLPKKPKLYIFGLNKVI